MSFLNVNIYCDMYIDSELSGTNVMFKTLVREDYLRNNKDVVKNAIIDFLNDESLEPGTKYIFKFMNIEFFTPGEIDAGSLDVHISNLLK